MNARKRNQQALIPCTFFYNSHAAGGHQRATELTSSVDSVPVYRKGGQKVDSTRQAKNGALALGGESSRYDDLDGCRENAGNDEHDWEPRSKCPPKLRQLDANDVDAVFAEGQRAINSLRDVQVTIVP